MTDELELRLRGALVARAGQITQERLRFGVPPTVAVPRARPRWWRWLPVPVAAMAVAGVLSIVLAPDPAGPEPVLPGGPAVTTPASRPPASAEVPAPSPAASSEFGSPLPSMSTTSTTPSAAANGDAKTSAPQATVGTKPTANRPAVTPGG